MGQQQLLLIVLSVIIVGVAVAVGVTQFKSGAVDSNRQALIGDLVNLGAKAQRYYRTPLELGGGKQDFKGFGLLSPNEYSNANGNYQVVATAPTGVTAISAAASSIAALDQEIFIVGSGTETGNNGINPLKVYARVTPDSIIVVNPPLN